MKIIIAVVVFAAVAIVAAVLIKERLYGTYGAYEVVSEEKVRSDRVAYYNDDNRLSLVTINGAKALDGNGNLTWEASFGLEDPTVVSCNQVSAIADIGGTNIYVISKEGIPHTINVNYPIVKVDVAQQGVVAVLLNDGQKDIIQVYDIDGKLRVEIGTNTKNEGFPVDIAISEDGKKLITLYVSFKGDDIMSKVTFYNADDVGKNFIENIVGQKVFEGRLVYDVDFLGNDTVGIMLEDGFALYAMKEIPKFTEEKTFDNIIDMSMYDGGVCVVSEQAGERTLQFFDLNGQESGTVKKLPEYDVLRAGNDEAILYSSRGVTIYRKNGTKKYSGQFDGTLDNVYFGGDLRYFLVDSGAVRTIKLVKKVKEER
ncbi:MAG: DUF5711 family protein [Lachnospiraceae bacterium]|nr:DUF5711 family protein [Lachnospiraceae bacterium]